MAGALSIPRSSDGSRPHSASLALLLSPLLALGACAHGEAVIHQRVPARNAGTSVQIAELIDDGGAPTLALRPLSPCGAGPGEPLQPALAAAAAAQVRAGAALEEALPPGLRAPPIDWRAGLELEDGISLHVTPLEDRYGAHLSVRLADAGGRGVELTRADPKAEVLLAPVPGDAALALARIDGPGRTRDLRLLDLAAGRRALHLAEGEAALAAGDPAAALASAEAATASLPRAACTPDGRPGWLLARALAVTGAPAAAVVEALSEAIAAEPQLYRMYARTAPELRRLAGDPAFAELVRPRRLQE